MNPKNQHYVPQFILANFCIENSSQIFVFDKRREVIFRTHIKNVAAERGFYNFKEGETIVSVESNLSQLESAAANIISKILEKESLASIPNQEKMLLSIFIAAQFIRVKQMRITMKQLNDDLANKIQAMGLDLNNIDGFSPQEEGDIKKSTILSMKKYVEKFAPYIYDKAWLLLKVPKPTPHYISDNPITLQNMNDYRPRGNLGLAVKGIEIYFPLSSKLSLGIFCRSHEELIQTGYKKYTVLQRLGLLKNIGIEKKKIEGIKKLKYGLETGNAIKSNQENVINRNSLQVMYSTRFIFSNINDFSLAREMIKDTPKLKDVPRLIGS